MKTTAPTIHRCPVILTKYLGPTNTRGARVKATCGSWTVTLAWDHERESNANHAAAAVTLIRDKIGRDNPQFKATEVATLRGGCIDGCDSFAWTFSCPGAYA